MQNKLGSLVMFIAVLMSGTAQASPDNTPMNGWYPRQARFTPDDTQLLVNVCQIANPEYCQLAFYDLTNKKWRFLPKQDPKRTYQYASYSSDGKTIIASSHECESIRCNYIDAKLTLLDADGGNPRELPLEAQRKNADPSRDPAVIIRLRPSFSPDGKRLIYYRMIIWQLASQRMFLPSYTLWELNLETMEEDRLLSESTFERIYSTPKYLPDGKRFLFSAKPSIEGNRSHMIFVNDRSDKRHSNFFFSEKSYWSVIFDISKDGKQVIYAVGFLGRLLYSGFQEMDVADEIDVSKRTIFKVMNNTGLVLDSSFSNKGDKVVLVRRKLDQTRNGSKPMDNSLWIVSLSNSEDVKQQSIALDW
jgi:hypothetical protein